ncbi:MAG: class I SAM-dependent methyltransferase [Lachnospiraceae bacterium]|nr:class I SAM-dependent methyltransferase [Lachnospiraceae bacterium]
MKKKYEDCKEQWNTIFKKGAVTVPQVRETGNKTFDAALDWLCEDTERILDFGCGSGSVLFYCALRGTRKHIGIDMSEEGIGLAMKRKEMMKCGEYLFLDGSTERLKGWNDNSIDAVVLSNVIDNMYPDDAKELLEEIRRILRPDGKALIKVNPYLSKKQQLELNISEISGNLLDDGMLLWNNTTEEWKRLFHQYFTSVQYKDVYYREYDMHNRMFLARKEEEQE